MRRAETLQLIREDLGDCLYRRWYQQGLEAIAEPSGSPAVTRHMRLYYYIVTRYAQYKSHESPIGNEEGE